MARDYLVASMFPMTHICRFVGIVLATTIAVRAEPRIASESPSEIRPANVEITGRGFEIHVLRKGAVAFRMRTYLWSDVPASVDGLRYTQMAGGGTATIHLKAKEVGRVYVAIAANQMLDLKEKGWILPMPDRSNTFTYSDANQTIMVVLSREVEEGQELDIPQLGWTGTILLLPAKSRGGEVTPAA